MKNLTIQDRLMQFAAGKGLSANKFGESVGLGSSHMSAIKSGTNFRIDILLKILSRYPELNTEWLFFGKGEMEKSQLTTVSEPAIPYQVLTETVDTAGNQLIPITDIKAAAGSGYMNPEHLQATDFVQLPTSLTKSGQHLCIRIKGPSMSPTLQDSGYVIIRLLDKGEWETLLSDRIYVISDIENKTYLKRVRNRFKNGFIVLTSDNPDKASYPNFNLRAEEITSIWYVEWYLSAKLPNIHNQFFSRIERLENNIEDLNRKFDDLERMELKRIKPSQP